MSKAIKNNLNYLNRLVEGVKGDKKTQVETLIKLYDDRQTSQVTTVEKHTLEFIEYDKAKDGKNKFEALR